MAEKTTGAQTRRLHEALTEAGIDYSYILDDSYYDERTSWEAGGVAVSYMEHHGELCETDSLVINSTDWKGRIGADYVIKLLGLS